MAAIAGASGPFVFRLSCELDETVRLRELQGALSALAPRFPFLFAVLPTIGRLPWRRKPAPPGGPSTAAAPSCG